jgi:hypothetical protein
LVTSLARHSIAHRLYHGEVVRDEEQGIRIVRPIKADHRSIDEIDTQFERAKTAIMPLPVKP